MDNKSLSIIIPAYNEAGRIGATIESYGEYFSQHYPDIYEIIVVLNACKDNTFDIVNWYADNDTSMKVFHIPEKGKGFALKHGFEASKGKILCFTDADGATSPVELHRLIRQINGYDAVIASRWLPDSVLIRKQDLVRRISSRVLNILVRLLFRLPFSDTQCGAKVFKKEALDTVIGDVTDGGFVFDIELLHKLRINGFRTKECAITWEEMGDSRINLVKVAPGMMRALIMLWFGSIIRSQRKELPSEIIP